MDLSIIVPVYNTEVFLEQCINSIIKQKGITYEIILVDDGSTDGAGNICDKYADRYSYIKVIHKKNGGANSARNAGLKAAKGRYVGFVDSDDWIDPDMYTDFIRFFEQHSEVDICIGCLKRNFPDGTEKNICKKAPAEIMDTKKALLTMLKMERYRWEMCDKVYRRELFYNITIDERIVFTEDLAYNWELFRKARYIYYDPLTRYHYRFNPNSLTSMRNIKNQTEWITFGKMLIDINNTSNLNELHKLILTKYVAATINTVEKMFFLNERKYKDNIREIQKDVRLKTIKENEIDIPFGLRRRFYYIMKDYNICRNYNLNIFANMQKLIEKTFLENENVYIFGTGIVAWYTSIILQRKRLECRAYVVSDGKTKKDWFFDKPVRYFSQLPVNEEIVIILAVKKNYQKEIIDTIKETGDKRFICLDYFI